MQNFLKVAPFEFSGIFGNISKNWYYYLILAIVLALIVLSICLIKKKRNNLSSTGQLVYVALCSALCFMANYFTIKVSDVLQLSFVAFAGFISGILLGGPWGFTASFIGDLLCGIVHPFGAYNPIIGIGNGLFGLIPGVIFSFKRGNNYFKVILSTVLTFICCTFFVNTLGLSLMYSMTFQSLWVLLPYKLIVALVNCVLSVLILKTFIKVLPKDKFLIYGVNEDENNVKS